MRLFGLASCNHKHLRPNATRLKSPSEAVTITGPFVSFIATTLTRPAQSLFCSRIRLLGHSTTSALIAQQSSNSTLRSNLAQIAIHTSQLVCSGRKLVKRENGQITSS
jgi:hypothetical protein